MKRCTCILVDNKCSVCLDKLMPVSDLYLKAMLEFFAKIEWIAAAHQPCSDCMVRHADDFGANFVTQVFPKMSDGLRQEIYEKLVLILLAKGADSVAKTKEAYQGLKWPGDGKLTNLTELLKALFGHS